MGPATSSVPLLYDPFMVNGCAAGNTAPAAAREPGGNMGVFFRMKQACTAVAVRAARAAMAHRVWRDAHAHGVCGAAGGARPAVRQAGASC
jgi:hypothetical protein